MNQHFVSRAGEKLEYALEAFKIDARGLICGDFGSSTGGFVDCLLQCGANKIYSVDTAYGELAWKLRNDSKVVLLERTNAMHVVLPEKLDLITIDTAWTKQEKVLPNALKNLKEGGLIISLIKPHYEANREELSKGRVKDEYIDAIIERTKQTIEAIGGRIDALVESPIVGEKGKNREFLALIQPQ